MTTKSEAVKYLESISGGPLTIGKVLQSYRQSHELSQEKVAKKLKISKNHLSQLERGHKFLSPERAFAFGKKLGVSPEVLVAISLQDQITRAKLPYKVTLEAA